MQTFNPLVSVIVPIYNAESYVADMVQSVLNQSYPHWELLLIDDGSTDQTSGIIQPFLKDDRIHYFYQENQGQGSARNVGIQEGNGTYLAFIDADDLWNEHKLKIQLKVLQKKDAGLVFSRLRYIDRNGDPLTKSIGSGEGFYNGFKAFFLLACGSIAIPNSSVIVKKEHVEHVGGFNEGDRKRNIEDFDLWSRLLLSGSKFLGLNEVLGSYRRYSSQITYNDSGQSLKVIDYLESLSHEYPVKKAFFKFLILQRLSMFYLQHNNKVEAKTICVQKFYSSSCLHTYWFEKYLIGLVKLNNYLRFRRLLIRRFRRFKTFLVLINN